MREILPVCTQQCCRFRSGGACGEAHYDRCVFLPRTEHEIAGVPNCERWCSLVGLAGTKENNDVVACPPQVKTCTPQDMQLDT